MIKAWLIGSRNLHSKMNSDGNWSGSGEWEFLHGNMVIKTHSRKPLIGSCIRSIYRYYFSWLWVTFIVINSGEVRNFQGDETAKASRGSWMWGCFGSEHRCFSLIATPQVSSTCQRSASVASCRHWTLNFPRGTWLLLSLTRTTILWLFIDWRSSRC